LKRTLAAILVLCLALIVMRIGLTKVHTVPVDVRAASFAAQPSDVTPSPSKKEGQKANPDPNEKPAAVPAVQPTKSVPDASVVTQRVLVFSKTAGFRHDSIPEGIDMFKRLGTDLKIDIVATEDSAQFTDEILSDPVKGFACVVFLNTTGDVLNSDQEAAFERFVKRGGGYLGIHAASDTEYGWAFYESLVGAMFKSHPAIQQATVKVVEPRHESTMHLPADWVRKDEWYDFRSTPRAGVRRLLRMDTSTYTGSTMGEDHPIAWCHEEAGGRAFYTGGGHTKESYQEPEFVEHVRRGLLWVLKRPVAEKP